MHAAVKPISQQVLPDNDSGYTRMQYSHPKETQALT
jgi:hypothetical protein